MNTVIINKAHTLMPDQSRLIGEHVRVDIPEEGWTLAQIETEAKKLSAACKKGDGIIIVSPVAALFKALVKEGVEFKVLHNDKRSAKEVKNADGTTRVIHTVATDGWVIY